MANEIATKYKPQEIINRVFDDVNNVLNISNTGGGAGGLTNTELRAFPVDINIASSAISIGGGTEYTEGDTDASITGSAILWEDTGDTLRAVSAAKPLPINIISGNITGFATSAKQDTGNTSLASIDGKITAVNTGAVVISSGNVTADTELTTADLDTGVGTDTRAVVGIVGSKSGGAQLIPGDATAGLKVDLGADNDVVISDGGNVITVDGTVAFSNTTIAVTNAGTFVTQENGALLTSAQLIDDIIYTSGDALSKTAGVAAQFDDVSPGAVTENKMAPLRMSSRRELYTTIRDAAGNERGLNIDSSGAIGVTGTFWQTTQPVSGTVTANIGTSGSLALESGGNLATAVASLSVMDDWDNTASDGASVSGDVAHDGVDAGEPVKVGGYAVTSLPTAVANADRTNAIFDKFGRQIVVPGSIRDLMVIPTVTTISSTTETTILSSVASTFLDVVAIIVVNTSATATRVDIRDATGGTVRFALYLPAGDTKGISLGGGMIIPQTTAANNWTAQLSGAVTDVRITAFAIKNL